MRPLDLVRRVVPQGIRRTLKRRLGKPATTLHGDWDILAPIGPVERPHVIIDCGANEGWFFHCWKDWSPSATVHAFEPATEAFTRAQQYYGADPSIHLVHAGVARASGELALQLMENIPLASSFLPHDPARWNEIDYQPGAISTRIVPVVALDDYARAHQLGDVYLLKLKVQGFELEALRGAAELLRRTSYVFVTSGVRPLYEGAPSFTSVHEHLHGAGFHLIGMRAWHRGNRTLVEADMLYRRNGLMPPVGDRGVDRIYTTVGR